ncbi:MAG: VWA domain-containing protein [Spirochaetales bacterium]|nr:VWA domain-containing protein [Spirochaetales bacterium]
MKRRKFEKIALLLGLGMVLTQSIGAQEIGFDTSISTPWMLAGQSNTAYLKISLTGFELEESRDRTPVNVAIVLDRSGSMEGDKIVRAREAAKMAVDLLDSRDIASIITYSDTVSVLVPATKVTDRRYIKDKIDSIYADGSTALFAGVSKGGHELEKFFDINKVNRVILLSDGLANVGPDSPAALGDLGASLRKMGISATTIGLGLGYNEDLMVRLAEKSDGNHAFVENSRDLARIFEYEFGDILSVVAQDLQIEITCAPGVRPVRVLGREAEIVGSSVITSINQIYSNGEKYVLLEVEVDSHRSGENVALAEITLHYNNMATQRVDRLRNEIGVQFTTNQPTVEENMDKAAMVSAVMQIAAERSEEAVILRDAGRVQEAKAAVQANSQFLQSNAATLDSDELAGYGETMAEDAESIESEEEWNATRKKMVDDQYEKSSQQSY